MADGESFPLSPWLPMEPQGVARVMSGAPFAWWLAGGFAVERWVGEQHRPHDDIDILVSRENQGALREWLADWVVAVADPPGQLRTWNLGEQLPEAAHDIWARRKEAAGWELQVMLFEAREETWIYRRDQRIAGALDDFGVVIDDIPCVRLEIQLLYKARSPRPKDDLDLDYALPRIDALQRATLKRWLQIAHPTSPWLPQLGAPTTPARGEAAVGLPSGTAEIVPWDPRWPTIYAEEASQLDLILSDLEPLVEHIGSTSVVGLAAKPAIDIAVGLRDDTRVAEAHRRLSDAGYDGGGDRGPERGGITFSVGPRSGRTHFVHLLTTPSQRWSDYLAFRETLRRDRGLRRQYGLVKAEAAQRHAKDRPAYGDTKKPFIASALKAITSR